MRRRDTKPEDRATSSTGSLLHRRVAAPPHKEPTLAIGLPPSVGSAIIQFVPAHGSGDRPGGGKAPAGTLGVAPCSLPRRAWPV